MEYYETREERSSVKTLLEEPFSLGEYLVSSLEIGESNRMFITSNHAHNTGMAKFISDKLYNYDTTDESTMNPMKWWSLQNSGKITDTRETINGFPIRLILVNDGETVLNEGQAEPTPGNTKDMGIFNFNNDKDNLNTMGMDTDVFPNCLSYEVTANSDTSAGAFVPYQKQITFGSLNKNDPLFIFNKLGYEDGDTITITNRTTSNLRLQFYYNTETDGLGTWKKNHTIPANGNYTVTLSSTNGNRALVNTSNMGEKSIGFEIDGIPILVDKTLTAETVIIEDDELEYLQNSFELRYPDEDDVGKDYGYLGMNVKGYVIKRRTGTDQLQYIPIEHFGDARTITITHDANAFHVFQYDEEKVNIKQQYSVKSNDIVTIEDNCYYIYMYGINQDEIIINNVKYYIENNDIRPIDGGMPEEKSVLSQDYGLKRVIDWVGNATREEFLADFDKYFNRHYTLRYYLLVVLMAGVDNLG